MKVHSKPGRGFKEVVYKDALNIEFINNKISCESEKNHLKLNTKMKFFVIGLMQTSLSSTQLFLK